MFFSITEQGTTDIHFFILGQVWGQEWRWVSETRLCYLGHTGAVTDENGTSTGREDKTLKLNSGLRDQKSVSKRPSHGPARNRAKTDWKTSAVPKEAGENCTMTRSCIICTLHRTLRWWLKIVDQLGGACSTYWSDERWTHNFDLKTLSWITHLEA
jgi:hypothetical protein